MRAYNGLRASMLSFKKIEIVIKPLALGLLIKVLLIKNYILHDLSKQDIKYFFLFKIYLRYKSEF